MNASSSTNPLNITSAWVIATTTTKQGQGDTMLARRIGHVASRHLGRNLPDPLRNLLGVAVGPVCADPMGIRDNPRVEAG